MCAKKKPRYDKDLLINGVKIPRLTVQDLDLATGSGGGNGQVARVRMLVEEIVRTDDSIDVRGGPAIPTWQPKD